MPELPPPAQDDVRWERPPECPAAFSESYVALDVLNGAKPGNDAAERTRPPKSRHEGRPDYLLGRVAGGD
ncbi:hypothetical protein [Roseomonas sp. WA12]